MWTLFTSLTHQSLIHWPTTPRPPGNCLEESQSAPRLHVTSCPTRSPLAHSPICCLVRPIPASRRPGSGLHRLGAQPRPINTHPDRARHPARHSRIASTPSSGLTSRAQSSSGFGFGRLEKGKKRISKLQHGDDSTRAAKAKNKKKRIRRGATGRPPRAPRSVPLPSGSSSPASPRVDAVASLPDPDRGVAAASDPALPGPASHPPFVSNLGLASDFWGFFDWCGEVSDSGPNWRI